MKVLDAAASRYQTFTKLGGGQFRGDILTTNGASGDTQLNVPFLVLETRANAQVSARDMFTAADGKVYLVAERSNRFHAGQVLKTFNIIPMNTYAAWLQYTVPTDPVTKLAGSPTYTPHPTTPNIWVFLEPVGSVSDGLQVEMEMFRLVTGYDVRAKDKIAGKIVQSVVRYLGVNVAEAK